jgi:hypothetical protein
MKIQLVFSLCVSALMLGACANQENLELQTCSGKDANTEYKKGSYVVQVFGPNSLDSPDIWEGPICIFSAVSTAVCEKDYSLIKEVAFSEDAQSLLVTRFSGSESELKQVELATCKELQ